MLLRSFARNNSAVVTRIKMSQSSTILKLKQFSLFEKNKMDTNFMGSWIKMRRRWTMILMMMYSHSLKALLGS